MVSNSGSTRGAAFSPAGRGFNGTAATASTRMAFGVLAVQSDEAAAFTPADQHFLESLGIPPKEVKLIRRYSRKAPKGPTSPAGDKRRKR